MNLFKPTTFTWEELGLFKWGIFLIGIAAGAEWWETFAPYVWWLLAIGLALCIPPGIAWFNEH
ncbi:MAG: hypothetical protein KGI78_04440 [Patescibacteria group bacterium]|nr:hypothetical protein [Patescibacteria group bacterium]MDE1945342.1 hypothetical protein [Patescibacteria group bacterium]MDE2058059.1 hypothetical protein [Patescibacteria group bacterium]